MTYHFRTTLFNIVYNKQHPLLPDDHLHTAPLVPLHKNLSCAQLEGALDAAMALAATVHVEAAAHEHEEELLRAQVRTTNPIHFKRLKIVLALKILYICCSGVLSSIIEGATSDCTLV
jgi:hypothetical protein